MRKKKKRSRTDTRIWPSRRRWAYNNTIAPAKTVVSASIIDTARGAAWCKASEPYTVEAVAASGSDCFGKMEDKSDDESMEDDPDVAVGTELFTLVGAV